MNKAAKKLPGLFSHVGVIVPDSSVVEQASGEMAGKFLSSLLHDIESAADITAGLGTDTYFLSRSAKRVEAIEIDKERAECLASNLKIWGAENVEVVNADCGEWLQSNENYFDVIYADPARRNQRKEKIVRIQDCSPDILTLMPLLRLRGKRLLLKLSPLHDIMEIFRLFPSAVGIYILEVKREVKELLVDIDLTEETVAKEEKFLQCVIIEGERTKEFCFKFLERERNHETPLVSGKDFLKEGGFLYEPSPAIMKSGMFGAVASPYPQLKKLARDTHLFLAPDFYPDFPGRVFRIKGLMTSSDLKKIKGSRYNVISRNHPAKAPEIENRYKLKSSDTEFLIALKANKDNVIVSAEKIMSAD